LRWRAAAAGGCVRGSGGGGCVARWRRRGRSTATASAPLPWRNLDRCVLLSRATAICDSCLPHCVRQWYIQLFVRSLRFDVLISRGHAPFALPCAQWARVALVLLLLLRGVTGQVYTCWDFTLTNSIMDWTTIRGTPVNRETFNTPNSDGDGIGIMTPDYSGSPYPQVPCVRCGTAVVGACVPNIAILVSLTRSVCVCVCACVRVCV